MHVTPSKNSISPRKMMLALFLLTLAVLFSVTIQSARAASVIFVDADATGAVDGSSWDDAYPNLQDALTTAVSGDEIWIAERALRFNEEQMPATHPDLATPLISLGEVYDALGDTKEAQNLYNRTYQILKDKVAPTHVNWQRLQQMDLVVKQ